MLSIEKSIFSLRWEEIISQLHENGYALVPAVVSPAGCNDLTGLYHDPFLYRKTVSMERYRFGAGEYKYFTSPLPPPVQLLREKLYPHLVPVANQWMQALHIDTRFPPSLQALLEACTLAGQLLPTPLILKYGTGGYNTLHQDLYGEVYFPLQAVICLNEPGKDFTGGEFVLVQQNLRSQSTPIVLNPGKGDMIIFTTQYRPVKGSRGYYRAGMKHGVSRVHSGHRHALGIIFHNAGS